MGDALAYFGDPQTTETEYFVQFDRFFDCLNVHNLLEWAEKKKDDLKPYTDINDERLKVCDSTICCRKYNNVCSGWRITS